MVDLSASLARRQRKYSEAEKAIRTVIEGWKTSVGLGDTTTVDVRFKLLEILILRGRSGSSGSMASSSIVIE
jgi:hypothetical protein